MFVLAKEASYSWPVKVSTPKDGGTYEKSTFEVKFKRLQQSKLRKVLKDEEATDASFCRDVVLDWKGVKDESGAEVPFSETALDQLLEIPGVAKSIVDAYLESVSGAKIKN